MRSTLGLLLILGMVGCGGDDDGAAGGQDATSSGHVAGGGGAGGSQPDGGGPSDGGAGASAPKKRSLFDDYQKTSPHYGHVTPMYTDFFYQWTPSDRDWAAAHFDVAMSGNMAEWKSRNPTVKHISYRLHWTVFQPDLPENTDYQDLTAWFADASMNTDHHLLEHAFLHYPAGKQFRDYAHAMAAQIAAYKAASNDVTKLPLVTATGNGSAAERIQTHIWDSWRYVYNPADGGSSAYLKYKLGTIVSAGHDGVFYDEYGSGGMSVAYSSLELDTASYQAAAVQQMAAEKGAFPDKIIMPNTGAYAFPFDLDIMNAAGHVQMEQTNDPLDGNTRDRWTTITSVLEAGVVVEFVSGLSWSGDLPSTFVTGNFATPTLRLKMAELASYYMIRPVDASKLLLDQNNTWALAPSNDWLVAEEADVGAPTAARMLLVKSTDATGQACEIYARDYERALVLMRPVVGWDPPDYGDATKVTAPLPAGESWYFLDADGKTHGPVTSVDLRVAEAAIVIKKSKVSGL